MKQITLFKEDDGIYAAKFNFIEGVDIDVTITKLALGYQTSINVIRSDYPGMVLCNALDQYDVVIQDKDRNGASGVIDRNHLKLQTQDRPVTLMLYKFDFQLDYEA